MTPTPHPLLQRRTSGVLLHLTSLPGRHGSGDLGAGAMHFIDWLATARQSMWQILPLAPPGPGHSPYRSPSAFAGSPWLVDLDDLVACGWLPAFEAPAFDTQQCEFERVLPYRQAALQRAWDGFQRSASAHDREALASFVQEQAHWLTDYSRFMVLESRHGDAWTRWPTPLARRDPDALRALDVEAATELGFWHFVQWRFQEQWSRVRTYANQRNVRILGDAPIFVDHHSADVWTHAEQFQLLESGEPTEVAGVPPDYFCAEGQRWGNPLYRWDAMAADDWRWWTQRLRHLLSRVDLVRLDHFRGFEACWAIPADQGTAVHGHWRSGPGLAFFEAMEAALGPLPFIAEDLGLITDAVTELRLACGFPGMRVAQFGFIDHPGNPHLPHNYAPATTTCTGTHDNNTAVGWWQQASERERHAAQDYLGLRSDDPVHWRLIQAVSQSVARTLIVPFQDVLGLDARHRMNVPGQASGCWAWRFDWSIVDGEPAQRLAAMVHAHGRT